MVIGWGQRYSAVKILREHVCDGWDFEFRRMWKIFQYIFDLAWEGERA
jgi:hypothetical protein